MIIGSRSSRGLPGSPEDKNAALLPRRVGEHFVLFHRPRTVLGGRADVWLSRSSDLRSWLAPERVFSSRPGMWDCEVAGVGPPPLETSEGWLVAYHGVRQTVAGRLYRVGLALLDPEDRCGWCGVPPSGCWGRGRSTSSTETSPASCSPAGGCTTRRPTSCVYYGAADTCVAMAHASLRDVLDFVMTGG